MIETIRPRSREEWLALRKGTVGFSEVPALFGVHPYLTPNELYAIKSGVYMKRFGKVDIRANSIHLPPVERGNFLESKAFELVERLRPTWHVTSNQIPGGLFFVDREMRMSCTPDAFIDKSDKSEYAIKGVTHYEEPTGDGVLQVKSMTEQVFNRDWKFDDWFEPPVSAAIQAIGDAALSGCSWACVGALVVGFNVDFYLCEIDINPKIMPRARELVSDFWHRIAERDPYPPDYARDGDVIRSVYANDDGGEVDLSGNERVLALLSKREVMKTREKEGTICANERKEIDAEIIHLLGNAVRGTLGDGRVIEAKTIRRSGFTVAPTSYRAVRVKGELRATNERSSSSGDRTQSRAFPDHF